MFQWLKRKSASKVLVELLKLAKATWTNRDYVTLSREGYIKNVVAYHCITQIAKAAAGIPYFLRVNNNDVETHPLLQLLNRPNPQQSYAAFMQQIVMHRLVSGNAYILGEQVSTGRLMELRTLRPDRVEIQTSHGLPSAYQHTINGKVQLFTIDPVTFQSDVLHIKEFNPIDDLYGLSPIQAAAMAIDQHNESNEWNKKLLENSARPPGILTLKTSESLAPLTKEQLENLSKQINEKYAGSKNAGKIPFLNADILWQNIGMSPADMDWINGKNTSARDICLAFGYPAFLLGMPEGATFNNVSEAKLSLYEETVIPLLQSTLSELSYYLRQKIKQNIEIIPDLDQVSALSPRREMLRNNVRQDLQAGLISTNEGREELGYDPVDGGDDILVPAGKLPLNFDVSSMNNMTKAQYTAWLKAAGYSEDFVQKIITLAYH